MPIKKLDLQTTNQIAAGEVVENPASVIKELIENALDAGAQRIRVSLKQGGLEEISVTDNGSGITAGEVRMALERYATSKITRIEDLESVASLGFRGEALPSIASVSRLSITTRHESENVGSYFFSEGGKETLFKETGFPHGTRVTVKNLFFNTPVRKKFLKSISAETARATRLVQNMALSRPDVAITLERHNQNVLQTPGDGKILNAILSVYGNEIGHQIIPVLTVQNCEKDYMLTGYISHPQVSRNNRNYQLFFVNSRYVKSNVIREELDQAFASIVTSKRFPIAFLFLSLPPGETDVNVHPTKTEIRFHNERDVRAYLRKTLEYSFSCSNPIKTCDQPHQHQKEQKHVFNDSKHSTQRILFEPQTTIPSVQEKEMFYHTYKNLEQTPGLEQTHGLEQTSGLEQTPGEFFYYDKILGQLFNTYILIQQENSLLVVDQHAAHERIIWEQMQMPENKESIKQTIIPLSIELSPAMSENVAASLDILSDMGLEMEQFGNNTFIIRTVPVFIKDKVTGELLQDILETVSFEFKNNYFNEIQKEIMIQISCKGSVKANQKLSIDEMESLLNQLKECNQPFYCPHGRPVFYNLEKEEIEKRFKRRN